MPTFRATGDGVRIQLTTDEAGILAELCREMMVLLDISSVRADPVVARLFPDGYEDDDDAEAGHWHDLVGGDLEEAKRAAVDAMLTVVSAGGPVDHVATPEEATAWLRVITDLRLAIGTRLGVDEAKMAAKVDTDDPDAAALNVLHWLGWMQERMLRVLRKA